jgi:hypothetical protein
MMVTWRDRVARSCSARDQHRPRVFLPTLACADYDLLFRLHKVPIWTFEGRRLSMGGVPREGVCSARAGFFSVLVFLGFLVI